MMLAALSLSGAPATAQNVITLPTLPSFVQRAVAPLLPPQRPRLKDVFPAGYDATAACVDLLIEGDGDLRVNFPARFPEPRRAEDFRGDYRLNCPTYTIERVRGKSMTVIGLTPAQLRPLLEEDYYDQAYLFQVKNIELQFGEGNTLLPVVNGDDEPDDSAVVAVRQPGTALQPVIFDGGVQGIAYDPARSLEIFQRGGTFWERMVWDAGSRVMIFDREFPFPKN